MRLITLTAALALAPAATAGISIEVTFDGTIEWNGINSGPLSNPSAGEAVTLSFLLDSDVFVNSGSFPTRGYEIDQASFALQFVAGTVGLQSPFPAGTPPLFVLRDNDPAVDGFLVANNVNAPIGVPLAVSGGFGQFVNNTYVTYGGDLLDSLDILGALGTHDFTGLTVFNWVLQDGPFEPMGIVFEQLTIGIAGSAWDNQGSALAGVAGKPRLIGLGDMSAGSANEWLLEKAAPSATSGLFVSLSSTPAAFKGGTLLPVPALIPPIILSTNGQGEISLPFTFPAGVPPGTELWAQWVTVDAAAVQGHALSNGIKGVAP